jgi:phage host-nuclease inhibitor protein Gam
MNETTRRKISEALKERGRLSRNLNRLLTEVLEQQSDASEELLRDYEDSHIEWL